MENSTRIIIIIGFSILMMTILGICCIGVQACSTEPDAVIILSNYTPPEIYLRPMEIETVELTPIENLRLFIAEDPTNASEWNISADYVCIDFAIDMAHNLTNDGYKAGVVNVVGKYHGIPWHCLNWIDLNGSIYYLEPQNDILTTEDVFMDGINTSIYIIRQIKIDSAERNRVDQRRWR